MNNQPVQFVGVVIQGAVLFFALLVLLGRIYFLEYHAELGIHVIGVPRDLLVYAVISPDVALMCFFWTAFIAPLYPAAGRIAERMNVRSDSLIKTLRIILIGIVVLMVSLILMSLLESVYSDLHDILPGSYGILYALFLVLMVIPAILLFGNLKDILDDSTIGKILGVFVGAVLAFWVFYVLITFPGEAARLEANRVYNEAQVVKMWLYESDGWAAAQEAGLGCDVVKPECLVRLVDVREGYLYLRPDTEDGSEERRLLSINAQDVSRIEYGSGLSFEQFAAGSSSTDK